MNAHLKGAIWALLLYVGLFLGWTGVAEYRYYQTLKKEHQEFFLTPLGQTTDGKTFTRKQFFDAMVAESAKANAQKAAQARKE